MLWYEMCRYKNVVRRISALLEQNWKKITNMLVRYGKWQWEDFFKWGNWFQLFIANENFKWKSNFYGMNKNSIVQRQYVPYINQMGTGQMQKNHTHAYTHIYKEKMTALNTPWIARSHNCIKIVQYCSDRVKAKGKY